MPGDDGVNVKRPDINKMADIIRIKNLEESLKEKENLFKKASEEKANLKAENLNLKNEVRQKMIEVEDFSREKALIEENL